MKYKNQKKETIRFKWENDSEYNYRIEIYNISGKVSKILAELAKYRQQSNPNYQPSLDRINNEIKKLNSLEVPNIYEMQHKLLFEGYDYYKKAYEILIEAFKAKLIITTSNDAKLAGKIANAATFLECGNAYVKIVNTKNFETLQTKQAEYIKKTEEVKQ